MSSTTTKRAIEIINGMKNYDPLEPATYADALPPDAAPLADLLRSAEILDLVKRFHDADRRAVRAQYWNRLLTQIAVAAGFCAGAFAGVYFIVGINHQWIAAASFGLLMVVLLSLLVVMLFRPVRVWKRRRLQAEKLRLKFFERIVQSFEPASDSLSRALAVECFRLHLYGDQKDWFMRRSKDKQGEARFWKRIGWIAAALTALGSIPQVVTFLDALNQQGAVFDIFRWLALQLPQDKRLYVYFSFLGFQLTWLLPLIQLVNQSSDLARTYRRDFRFLKRNEPHFEYVREAAMSGKWAPVNMFTQIVITRLGDGVEEWASDDIDIQ